jgi:hypothetical protein
MRTRSRRSDKDMFAFVAKAPQARGKPIALRRTLGDI